MPSIFLSYSFSDTPKLHRLTDELRKRGVRVLIAEEQFGAATRLSSRAEALINEADFFGLIVSRNSIKSISVEKRTWITQ